jgi:alpha-glucosidase (family GH31 glycosyl hydrolase)
MKPYELPREPRPSQPQTCAAKHPTGWRLAPLLLGLAIPIFTGADCGDDTTSHVDADTTWAGPGGTTVVVHGDPFALVIKNAAGEVVLESASPEETADEATAKEKGERYAPLAFTHAIDRSVPVVMYGWDHYRGEDEPFQRATRVSSVERRPSGELALRLASDGERDVELVIASASTGSGIRLTASATAKPKDTEDTTPNRVSFAFKMHDGPAADHFFGFGERFVHSDQRGRRITTWVEDGGFGHGEAAEPGLSEPSPSGEGETNMPIPWLLSPHGFGIFQSSTYRTTYHLGDERQAAWRIEATAAPDGRAIFDATIFVDADPLKLVEKLTEITGRPPAVADWLLAPRRRANIGTDEMDKLRAAHVPTSVIDTAFHYFPTGVPASERGAPMRAITDDIHRRGFKAVTYFCPFVADSWHPMFEELAAKGFLVKKKDGSTYTVLDPPHYAGMIDFTNPAAYAWYQDQMKAALDEGWDGWMYDFAEYIPQDAVLANGMTGFEAHNLYPVLYQRAAFELLEKERPGDYLIFVRSGFAGTGGLTPMVWAGDQSTDFSRSDGLPAVLTGALNAGMSGIPLWGSDISGYHYQFNPPPDKDVYLRWTELGAFSADMHDENEGAGEGPSSVRWQIWKDAETLAVYKRYAQVKTQMIPYVRLAVNDARKRGTPVMRHLFLAYPRDARVYGITDEYLYGDSLLVAPVVARGASTKNLYLPAGGFYDFWSGARVAGDETVGREITVAAPLDVVPVFAKAGAIIPMLSSDVETVIPSTDNSVISSADRASFLELRVFAGGDAKTVLDDATEIEVHAPTARLAGDPAAPSDALGPLPRAADDAELATCARCFKSDAAARLVEIVVTIDPASRSANVDLAPLSAVVRNSTNVKRYLLTLRY